MIEQNVKAESITRNHQDSSGIPPMPDEETFFADDAAEAYFENHEHLKGVKPHIIRKAWFTMAHLILPDGSQIANLGCGKGAVTKAMAALFPHMHFIGIDYDKKLIKKAQKEHDLPNLEFRHYNINDDIDHVGIKSGSLDAIINSFTLHEIYSQSNYSDRAVTKSLDQQFTLLKDEGLFYIRDYALRFPGEYVTMEMPDHKTGHDDITKMSETELLLWYAENARSKNAPVPGFFIEELPPRFPKTRYFRLPYKWAYEFILRKDKRDSFTQELDKEYTFFTERDFKKSMRAMGARALYAAPHWDDHVVTNNFDGHFRIYDDSGKSMGPPPTSFIMVGQKVAEKTSIGLRERRPSSKPTEKLRVTTMRDEKTGKFVDIVTKDTDVTEILPYRVDHEENLKIYIHEALPRGIVNAVPRNGRNLDGRKWSGHMIEAISVPTHDVLDAEEKGIKQTVRFAQNYLGLKPTIDGLLEEGRSHYPAPDYIDEVIKTRFIRIAEQSSTAKPKTFMEDIQGFSSFGRIREVNAQQILNAIQVGLIPNARLEIQILELFDKLDIKAESWREGALTLPEADPEQIFNARDFNKLRALNDNRFKKSRGSAGQLRTVHSIFIDEGVVDGGIEGMASRDMEFVIPEDQTLNKASIIPLTTKAGKVMMGFETEYMPVPQRHEGNGLMMKAPTVNLPKDITNVYQAKQYVADLFKVSTDEVWRLGESYYCHNSITPQRIFSFAVATKGKLENPMGGMDSYAPLLYCFWLYKYDGGFKGDTDLISKMIKTSRLFVADGAFKLQHKAKADANATRNQRDPKIFNTSSLHGAATASPEASTSETAEQAQTAPAGSPVPQPKPNNSALAPFADDFARKDGPKTETAISASQIMAGNNVSEDQNPEPEISTKRSIDKDNKLQIK